MTPRIVFGTPQPGSEFVVGVDKVSGKIDYHKLIDQFGCQEIDEKLIETIESVTKRPVHPFLKRGLYYKRLHTKLILSRVVLLSSRLGHHAACFQSRQKVLLVHWFVLQFSPLCSFFLRHWTLFSKSALGTHDAFHVHSLPSGSLWCGCRHSGNSRLKNTC